MKKTYLLIYCLFVCVLSNTSLYGMREKVIPPTYHPILEVSEKEMLALMETYVRQRQYDSVAYYYDKVKANTQSDETLGIAALYISEKKVFEKEYFEAIVSIYTALDYFKKNNAIDKEISSYLKLARIYNEIRSTDLSKEVDSILIHQYANKPISKLQRSLIQISHATYIASHYTKETSLKAVQLLKTIDIRNFSNEPYLLKRYYEEILIKYSFLNMTDSAYVYLKKMYEVPNALLAEDEAKEQSYFASLAYKEKKYAKSLYHINRAKKSPTFKYLKEFDRIKFHKMEYYSNKNLGNYVESLHGLEDYVTVRDNVKNFNLRVNASILNFKLKRDQKIQQLKAKNEMNELVMEEKKKFYIFSTLVVSVSVSFFIFILILHQRKKKRLKLEYENEKMKEIVTIKNNFIENLSHEIRTPITVTTGYLQMIKNNVMDYSKIVKYSDLTIRNNEQIVEMLNGFLTLLRSDKKSSVHKEISEKMEKFLKETVYAFQGVSEIKGVPIYYKSNIKANQIVAYPYDDLRKIINNLISNALKYTSPTHGIYVHTYIDKSGLNIVVKDEGIGIDKEEQKLIFDRFYQSENHLVTGGFGIGLSLVHELVTKLNGTIQLDSEKHVGSVFTIQLPLAIKNHLLYVNECNYEYQSIVNSVVATTTTESNLPKILIVDDSIEMIGYLKELLSPILNCTFAFDGAQALKFAKHTQYDIILTDLRMPLVDGHELKTTLDTFENYQAVPYIVMTASAEEYVENHKDELGINDYVIKPFESMELITRINFHLEKNIYKKQLQSTESEVIDFNGAYSEFMEKINKIILENISNNDFTINELAQQCGYSRKQFTQIVQEQTGLTPVKVILEVRMQKAYKLIVIDKYQSINEVYYAVGINSRTYFNKVFTKRFGVKPGELIKKLKSKNVA
jgi:signal transduction histidine kinase/DNA-binding response OmpR family regulator